MGKKRNRKNAPGYTGGRHRGADDKPVKNLIRLDDGKIKNSHGVVFTAEEKRALENAVNRANYQRKKMLNEAGKMPRLINVTDERGKLKRKETGDTVKSLHLMGVESDFILHQKSKSLQRFKTKEDYNRYMKNLSRVNSDDYIIERIKLYKRNHIKAIRRELGDEGIAMRIRMMKPAEYMKLSQQYEDILEIHYIYGVDERQAKINQIRAALGMKIKDEEDIDSEFYDI